MRNLTCVTAFLTATIWLRAQTIPVITTNPTNQTVLPGATAVMNVSATGATSYQWRFDGTDLADATGATLSVTSSQFSNSGYYFVLAKNSVGWVPSQMAYLSVVDTFGRVPFSNRNNAHAEADYQFACGYYPNGAPITNGTAQVLAGPALDQM